MRRVVVGSVHCSGHRLTGRLEPLHVVLAAHVLGQQVAVRREDLAQLAPVYNNHLGYLMRANKRMKD